MFVRYQLLQITDVNWRRPLALHPILCQDDGRLKSCDASGAGLFKGICCPCFYPKQVRDGHRIAHPLASRQAIASL